MSMWLERNILGSITLYLLMFGFTSANENCKPRDEDLISPVVGLTYYHLYSKMEESLVNNHVFLDQLNNGFRSQQEVKVYVLVTVHVDNGTNVSCSDDQWERSPFYSSNSTNIKWDLCTPLHMVYGFKSNPILQSAPWLSALHGSVLLTAMLLTSEQDSVLVAEFFLPLEIDELHCNPSVKIMRCAASELLSWVS